MPPALTEFTLVATAPGLTADEPPRVPTLRASVATAEVGRSMAVVPGAVATLLFLIMLR